MSEGNAKPNGNKANGTTAALLEMASKGDNWVKLATLVFIGISGGANFVQTGNQGEQLASEVHALYSRVDDFEQRQTKSLSNQQTLLGNQERMLKNQAEVLDALRSNQAEFLKQFSGKTNNQ